MCEIWIWLQMEGYGAYVWGAYGFAMAALALLAKYLRASAQKTTQAYAKFTQGDLSDLSAEKFR